MATYETIWRNKFIEPDEMTLESLIAVLRASADELEEMRQVGITLREESNSDYYFLTTEDPEVAAKFGLVEEDVGEDEGDWDDDEDESDVDGEDHD